MGLCDWYWGFGYIETYTNNACPSKARDISSHQHWDGFTGQQEEYKDGRLVKGEYVHSIYDSKGFVGFVFTEKEGWILSELFMQFYLCKKFADFCHKKPSPGCNLTTAIEVNHGDMKDWYNKINKEMILRITAEIIRILTPVPTPE